MFTTPEVQGPIMGFLYPLILSTIHGWLTSLILGSIPCKPVAGQPAAQVPQVRQALRLPPSGSFSMTMSLKDFSFFFLITKGSLWTSFTPFFGFNAQFAYFTILLHNYTFLHLNVNISPRGIFDQHDNCALSGSSITS